MNEMANGPIKIEMRARQTLDEETSVLPPSWQETMAPVRKRIGARGLAFLLISVVPTLLFAAYLWMFAADQYVSEFRFTVQHTSKGWIFPARHHAGSTTDTTNVMPMGLRMRLKASFDDSKFTGFAKVIATALKRYGIIMADNGSNWYIT